MINIFKQLEEIFREPKTDKDEKNYELAKEDPETTNISDLESE